MATLSKNDVKQSELLDRLVLDIDTTEIVGHVRKLWLDVKSHQVRGLTCTSGLLDREKHMFSWDKVVTVGHDSILVNTENLDEVEQPELINDIIAIRVWIDADNKVGRLVDYCVDTTDSTVVAYLYTSNSWRGITSGTYVLSPEAGITVGSKLIIVADASIADAQQYEDGLNKKVQHAKKFIREDIATSQEDFGVVMQNPQKAASELQTKAHRAAEVAKEKLSDAAKQLHLKTNEAPVEKTNSSDRSEANSLEDQNPVEEIDRHLPSSDIDSEPNCNKAFKY